MIFFLIMIVGAILGGILASNKNRNVPGWALLCFFLPICVLFILALKQLPGVEQEEEPTIVCRQCGSKIPASSNRCRFCSTVVMAEDVEI